LATAHNAEQYVTAAKQSKPVQQTPTWVGSSKRLDQIAYHAIRARKQALHAHAGRAASHQAIMREWRMTPCRRSGLREQVAPSNYAQADDG
jgi:hypothetical protein